MQYDIVAKRLLELGKLPILNQILGIPAVSAELIEELPKESVSVRSTDFALRTVDKAGQEKIVLLEFQTRWQAAKPRTLAEYRIRFQRKYPGTEIIPCMMLLLPNKKATNFYEDNFLTFRFHLIKLWELEAKHFQDANPEILPLLVLMQGGLREVEKIEKRIYEANLERDRKGELLTALAIFAGLKDTAIVEEIIKRRKDIMIESPAYDIIKEEGIKEGIEKGKQEGLQEGLWKGKQEGLQEGLWKGKQEGLQEGLWKGKQEGKMEAAKGMLDTGADLEFVIKATGLSEEDLKKAGLV